MSTAQWDASPFSRHYGLPFDERVLEKPAAAANGSRIQRMVIVFALLTVLALTGLTLARLRSRAGDSLSMPPLLPSAPSAEQLLLLQQAEQIAAAQMTVLGR